MTDLLRQEIATAATTIVVKVGTRVLTRDDGRLDESGSPNWPTRLHQVIDTGRKVVAGQFRGGGGGHGPAGAEAAAHRPGPSPGRGRRRPEPAGRGLRAVACAATAATPPRSC